MLTLRCGSRDERAAQGSAEDVRAAGGQTGRLSRLFRHRGTEAPWTLASSKARDFRWVWNAVSSMGSHERETTRAGQAGDGCQGRQAGGERTPDYSDYGHLGTTTPGPPEVRSKSVTLALRTDVAKSNCRAGRTSAEGRCSGRSAAFQGDRSEPCMAEGMPTKCKASTRTDTPPQHPGTATAHHSPRPQARPPDRYRAPALP